MSTPEKDMPETRDDRRLDQPGPRRRRGRLLLVGDWASHRSALPPLTTPADEVPTLVEAVGAVSSATSRRPIGIVLVRYDGHADAADHGARALRRVDPAVPVVLAADENGHAGDLDQLAAAFDDIVTLPADTDRLECLLAEVRAPHVNGAGHGDQPQSVQVTSEPRDQDLRPDRGQECTAAEPPVIEVARIASDPRVDDLLVTTGPGGLGDLDLVEAILARHDDVATLAVSVIAQQTGWGDLRLTPASVDDADPVAATESALNRLEIRRGDESFGWLTTSQADPDQLEPWATWLSGWLALERTMREQRRLSNQDDLTGAWNRRFFTAFLNEKLEEARAHRRPVTVMVFDIDDFKRYNDRFGHEAGDVILTETVRLLNSVIRRGDRVCRIGGDEFAVIFADPEGPRSVGSEHPSAPENIAKRFQDQIFKMRFPKLGLEAPGSLSISAGLATFPWDGSTPEDLLREADKRALQSKRKGKNAITLGPGTTRP
jgi:diguanylate cyclase (GGDEF)-like protein